MLSIDFYLCLLFSSPFCSAGDDVCFFGVKGQACLIFRRLAKAFCLSWFGSLVGSLTVSLLVLLWLFDGTSIVVRTLFYISKVLSFLKNSWDFSSSLSHIGVIDAITDCDLNTEIILSIIVLFMSIFLNSKTLVWLFFFFLIRSLVWLLIREFWNIPSHHRFPFFCFFWLIDGREHCIRYQLHGINHGTLYQLCESPHDNKVQQLNHYKPNPTTSPH